MRSHLRLASTLLGLVLVLSACSGADPDPAATTPAATATETADEHASHSEDEHAAHTEDATDGADHSAHGGGGDGQPRAVGPVSANVLGTSTGTFSKLPAANPASTVVIEGTSTMVKGESGTVVTSEVSGMAPDATYPGHLHDGSCSDFGGHYMDDPSGVGEPPNEIWQSTSGDPAAGIVPNPDGTAVGEGSAPWLAVQQPLSMMIHDSEFPGLPLYCADFAAYDAPATLVLEATQDDVASIEYTVNDGEWVAYDGPVEIAEPGEYTVSFVGINAAGERTEPGEISFAVAGA